VIWPPRCSHTMHQPKYLRRATVSATQCLPYATQPGKPSRMALALSV